MGFCITQASTPSMEGGDDAFMGEMMRQLESMADSGEFENLLEGMMQQLMSKELLYEPMKHMAENVSGILGKKGFLVTNLLFAVYQLA